jgi:hypothetical protein
MNKNSYGKSLIHSLIKLSGVPDDQMFDFIISIIRSHNLAPDLVSLNNIKEILEKEIQSIVLTSHQNSQPDEG